MNYIHRKEEHNTKAAKEVVPILIDLFKPSSVIDIGCGIGTWLKIFKDLGVENFIGIDGNNVNKALLEIDEKDLKIKDLEKEIIIDKKYDLLLCLEVAEHLSIGRAESFTKNITSISDTIIFSAAIPNQGGQNHLNEQYPSYWIDIFCKNNFECFDLIRPKIWNNSEIDWWYRQNILVFKKNITSNSVEAKKINPLISQELYEIKLEEIKLKEKEIINIKSGRKRYLFYINGIFKRLKGSK